YVRAQRAGDEKHKRFYTDFSQPVTMEGGADLMLLRPDGSEELLVEGGEGAITDPIISFDAQWCYYVKLYSQKNRNQWTPPSEGADIFKIHLKTKRIVRLTNQVFTPNTGMGNWTKDYRADKTNPYRPNHFAYGVYNMGLCPLPGGKIVFTSNRDGYKPSKGYPAIALQMFVMDDSDTSIDEHEAQPNNIHKIGHFNIAGALHPVVMTDGRIMFSSLESQGIRSSISWGIWTMNPDGTNWNPMISAFDPGGASNGFHFQTQISDGSIIIEGYYNQNNSGFGSFVKLPSPEKTPYPSFGNASMRDKANPAWHFGHHYNSKVRFYRMPFMPMGSVSLTPFAHIHDGPADYAIAGDKTSPQLGKVTHPSGAPDNHLLCIYSPGPTNHQYTYLPQLDGGIYLLKNGEIADEPADLLLIKNDPKYNESWPRAVVPYKRVYGIDEPKKLPELANDGKVSPHLPEGTPFGLVGTSSFYKRETYPEGIVPKGKVTSEYVQLPQTGNDPWRGLDAFTSHGNGMPLNWHNQGADAGLYTNDDIHAVRIVVMEPTTDRHRGDRGGRQFFNHATERLRVLGEIPLRKFEGKGERAKGQGTDSSNPQSAIRNPQSGQPLDPDGNPDTSFLAKIPADTPFTFQTIDKRGMVLNMAQTWHQLRPGEMRVNCGGCHSHSQEPTDFSLTAAAKPGYEVWDLTKQTPLVTEKAHDKSKQKWDAKEETGVKVASSAVVDVEYFKDVQPIFLKSCVACHTKTSKEPAGNLILDADEDWMSIENNGKFPATYVRLAMDEKAKFGHKPPTYDSWGYPNASRYIRKMQSRRSLLVWKLYGERLDGFKNEDHPSEPEPGAGYLMHKGEKFEKQRHYYDIDFTGSQMPPKAAVEGKYKGVDGKMIKVEPVTDEDRRTIVRWIDLGCPVDLDRRVPDEKKDAKPQAAGAVKPFGWFGDDNRPVLTLTWPQAGASETPVSRIVIGMDDYYSGLDEGTFTVTASVGINGTKAGDNLASLFKKTGDGIWELKLKEPISNMAAGRLTVSVRDKQGNINVIDRRFSVAAKTVSR
ncbi:MAG: hypothetical protein WD768_13110, partial [Phycisphaeraceae bacterium]